VSPFTPSNPCFALFSHILPQVIHNSLCFLTFNPSYPRLPNVTYVLPVYPHLPQVNHVSPCLPSFTPSYPLFTLFTLIYPKLPTFHPVFSHLPQVTHVSPCLPSFTPSYPIRSSGRLVDLTWMHCSRGFSGLFLAEVALFRNWKVLGTSSPNKQKISMDSWE